MATVDMPVMVMAATGMVATTDIITAIFAAALALACTYQATATMTIIPETATAFTGVGAIGSSATEPRMTEKSPGSTAGALA